MNRLSLLSCLSLLPLALTGACAPDGSGPTGTEPTDPGYAQDSGADVGGGGPLDSDPGAGGGDTPDKDTGNGGGGGGDTGAGGASEVTHFVVLGDGGTGREHQFAVADAVEAVCAQNPCDFALYLGDNFYSDGVSGVDDSQWQDKFELPYQHLDFPFYAVLGNHDYGDGGGGFEEERAQAEVDYTAHSNKWRMPSRYYSHEQGPVTLIGLDTTALDWGRGQDQFDWIPTVTGQATTPWKIAYGHHHYRSNGARAEADGDFKTFIEGELCGEVDLYFSGHEHSLQWLEPTCGTEFVISGSAGKMSEVGHGNWPSLFEQEVGGFLWVEIDGDTFTGVFYDSDATELYRRSFTRAAR